MIDNKGVELLSAARSCSGAYSTVFAEYSGLNHFTQTAIRSTDRGEIMRWPPRMKTRRPQ